MALREKPQAATDNTTTTATPNKPPFETEETGTETVAETKAEAAAPAPAPSASREVAAPVSTGVSISAKTTMKGLEWAIPAHELENMNFGVFPRITVGLDGFSRDKDDELGKKIKVAVLSWNQIHMVVTGEQNNAEANKLIKTSYDGVNLLKGGGTVSDYIKFLKSDGYEKTTVKQYVEMYCNLLEYQTDDGKTIVVPEDEQEIVQVSLSPQSVGQWMRYMLESGLRKSRGIDDTNVVVMTQQRKVLGATKFGLATFTPK